MTAHPGNTKLPTQAVAPCCISDSRLTDTSLPTQPGCADLRDNKGNVLLVKKRGTSALSTTKGKKAALSCADFELPILLCTSHIR